MLSPYPCGFSQVLWFPPKHMPVGGLAMLNHIYGVCMCGFLWLIQSVSSPHTQCYRYEGFRDLSGQSSYWSCSNILNSNDLEHRVQWLFPNLFIVGFYTSFLTLWISHELSNCQVICQCWSHSCVLFLNNAQNSQFWSIWWFGHIWFLFFFFFFYPGLVLRHSHGFCSITVCFRHKYNIFLCI